MITNNEESSEARFVDNEKIAILCLKPKQLLISYVRDIAKRSLGESESHLNKILDNNYMEMHSVPVCIGRYETNTELEDFLQNYSDVLINLMLTSWAWPINKWGFEAKNKGTIQSLMAVEYRPFVHMSSQNIRNPLKLVVTYADPTRELTEHLARSLDNGTSEEELESLRFKVRSGIAIITDNIQRQQYHNPIDYCSAIANSVGYLKSLDEDVLKELLLFFYGTKEKLPTPSDFVHINQWFNFTSNQGLYMLTRPWMASRYRRSKDFNGDSFY